MAKEKINKVVLAYSGGLDTSVIIPWLKENYDCEVIAVCADVGQGDELNAVHDKALKSGASKVFIADLTKDFIENYIFPTLKANAVYEEKYLLGTSFARPIIAKKLVEIAKQEGAEAIAHGATGKGNDQVRFELTIKALAPELKIIAPWREWNLDSREAELEYAKAHDIEIPTDNKKYSMDRNIWHLSHEGSDLEDPWNAPNNSMFLISKAPEDAPDKPEEVTIDFEKGIPVAVNGEKRLVGMKSRGVYENPAGSILYYAHRELEYLCLDRATFHFKQHIAVKYGELVYDGMWFCQLREALAAFVDSTQETVTGTVKLKLYLFGLPLKVRALVNKK